MNNSEVAETRLRYHHIGICATVYDGIVTDLLPKIVANELSNHYANVEHLIALQKQNYHESRHILSDFLLNRHEHGEQFIIDRMQALPFYEETVVATFEGIINAFTNQRWNFGNSVQRMRRIITILNNNPEAYESFIRVLVESLIRSLNCSAPELNYLLLSIYYRRTPYNNECVDEQLNRITCEIEDCTFHYNRGQRGRYRCRLVSRMNRIRNLIVHRYFKFKTDQEKLFLDTYKAFIDRVDFQQIFPLNGEATREKYENIISVHKAAERRRSEQDIREEKMRRHWSI